MKAAVTVSDGDEEIAEDGELPLEVVSSKKQFTWQIIGF